MEKKTQWFASDPENVRPRETLQTIQQSHASDRPRAPNSRRGHCAPEKKEIEPLLRNCLSSRYGARTLSPPVYFVVLCFKVGTTLLTALIATQGVCGSQADVRPPEQETQVCIARGVSCSGLEFLLAASELLHSPETPWKDNPPEVIPYRGLAQTCRALLHSRVITREFRAPQVECLAG